MLPTSGRENTTSILTFGIFVIGIGGNPVGFIRSFILVMFRISHLSLLIIPTSGGENHQCRQAKGQAGKKRSSE